MKWAPDAFWTATPHDLYAALGALDIKKWLADEGPNLTRQLLDAETKDEG